MNQIILLGVPSIDRQHLELFDSLRKLATSAQAHYPDEALSDALSKLNEQILHHFTTEEALMKGLGLPDSTMNSHLLAHRTIMEELAQIHIDAISGRSRSLPDLIGTVADWVHQHLLEFDLQLKPYIEAQLAT